MQLGLEGSLGTIRVVIDDNNLSITFLFNETGSATISHSVSQADSLQQVITDFPPAYQEVIADSKPPPYDLVKK